MRRVKQDTSSMPPCGFIASVCAAGLHIVHSVAPLQCCYCCWEHVSAQHSTAQHSTAQHSTAQHSTAQHSTAQHSTAQHSTAQLSSAQLSTAQHSTAQHSSAQLSSAQHSTAQHSTAQHSTATSAASMFLCRPGFHHEGCVCASLVELNTLANNILVATLPPTHIHSFCFLSQICAVCSHVHTVPPVAIRPCA